MVLIIYLMPGSVLMLEETDGRVRAAYEARDQTRTHICGDALGWGSIGDTDSAEWGQREP